jgi:hypothetical protein
MHRIGRFVVCFGLFCLASITHAAADPVSITSGFLLVTGPLEVGSISITGTEGFSLDAKVDPSEGRIDALQLECDPLCLPGSTISLGAFQGGPSFNGRASLGGNSYQLSGGIDDPATVALEFFGTATLPGLQNSLVITAPFNAMGWFSVLSRDQTLMSGAGVVSVWLSQSSYPDLPRGWVVDQLRYDFSDPAPIPEPATLSLLGIGLAATALRARARRKENAKPRA